jgi:hypothetical protein
MTDTNLFGLTNGQLQVKEPDWLALAQWNNDGDYDPADKKYSPAGELQWLKNNPTDLRPYKEQVEEPTPPTIERKRKFRSRAESRMVQPPSWLIQDLFQEGTDIAIYAPSGYCKSFVAIDLAMALATGKPALGSLAVARHGVVFYAAGEGKANLEKRRVTAWEVARGFEPYGVENLYVGEGLIASNDETISADIGEMKEILGDRTASGVFVDTLGIALNGLDEDKSHVAARYFAFLRRLREETGAAVSVTIGHFGKDHSRGERGSSHFRASFDTVIWITNHKKDDAGVHTIEIEVQKQKDGEDGQKYWLQTRRVETPDGDSLVLQPLTEDEAAEVLSDKRKVSKDDVAVALSELCRGGGHVSKRQLARHLESRFGMSTSGVEKALDRGLKNGTLSQFCRDGKWSPAFKDSDQTFTEQMAEAIAERTAGLFN